MGDDIKTLFSGSFFHHPSWPGEIKDIHQNFDYIPLTFRTRQPFFNSKLTLTEQSLELKIPKWLMNDLFSTSIKSPNVSVLVLFTSYSFFLSTSCLIVLWVNRAFWGRKTSFYNFLSSSITFEETNSGSFATNWSFK